MGKSASDMANRIKDYLATYPVFKTADPQDITVAVHYCEHPAREELLFLYALRPRLNSQTKDCA